MLQYLVFVGAAVLLLGCLSYIKETLKGTTKPNRVTWLLWSIAPLIATFAAISGGVGWSVLPVFMAGFGPLLVFIASFVNKNMEFFIFGLSRIFGYNMYIVNYFCFSAEDF